MTRPGCDGLATAGGFADERVVKGDRFRTLFVVSHNGRRRRARHLSVWTEPMADAPRPGDDIDTADAEAIGAATHELLGSLAVVRGVARLLLQDPHLAASERSSLLTVLDRQVDLMQSTLSGIALERSGWDSARPLALDDISGT